MDTKNTKKKPKKVIDLNLTPVIFDIVSGRNGFTNPIDKPQLGVLHVHVSQERDPAKVAQIPDLDDVEDVEVVEDDKGVGYAYTLFLTDTKYVVRCITFSQSQMPTSELLTIPGVLARDLHEYMLKGFLCERAIVRLLDYEVRTAPKIRDDMKFTRYIVANDLDVEYTPKIEFEDDDHSELLLPDWSTWPKLPPPSPERPKATPKSQRKKLSHLSGTSVMDKQEHSWPVDKVEPKTMLFKDELSKVLVNTKAEKTNLNVKDAAATQPKHSKPSQQASNAMAVQASIPRAVPIFEQDDDILASPSRSRRQPNKTPRKLIRSIVDESPTKRLARDLSRQSISSNHANAPDTITQTNIRPPIFKFPENASTPSQSHLLPSQSQGPLHITLLGDLAKKSHGNKTDILAVVSSIDEECITRSIGVKRDVYLMDHTSTRPTTLSVWVDPEMFSPPVGTIILFRNLFVHRYQNKSLNAFAELKGKQWYEINPMMDAAKKVKVWWEMRQQQEQEQK